MSAADKRERRTHFRGKPRPGRRVEVEYRVEGNPPVSAYTRNIGVGGAFVVTPTPPPPGTRVRLAIRIPTASQGPLEVDAEVRWNARGDVDEVPGMGVKFLGLDVEELLALNEYFASLTGADDGLAE